MQSVNIKDFKLIGISIRTCNAGGQAAQEIGALWGRFMAEGIQEKIPNKVDQEILSLYTDYEGDHTQPYTAILGCKVDSLEEIPAGMVGRSFSGGSYMKSSARGDLMGGLVLSQWEKIFEMDWDRAYRVDFEVFGEKAHNPSDAEVDFYVGVK